MKNEKPGRAQVRQVATRIKTLREISGIPAGALARELKVPEALYRRYESGAADIPVSVLFELAHRFKVELTALLTGEEPRLRRYCLVRSGTAPAANRRKEYKYQDLAWNFAGKKSEAFLITVDPRPAGVERRYYAHEGQEFTYLLEGTLKVVVDGREVVLEKGDSLYFDSGRPHAMIALKGRQAKFLAVIL